MKHKVKSIKSQLATGGKTKSVKEQLSGLWGKSKDAAKSAYKKATPHVKAAYEKTKEASKEAYGKAEGAVKQKIHDEKKKIALQVMAETKNMVTGKEEQDIAEALPIVSREYKGGGKAGDVTTYHVYDNGSWREATKKDFKYWHDEFGSEVMDRFGKEYKKGDIPFEQVENVYNPQGYMVAEKIIMYHNEKKENGGLLGIGTIVNIPSFGNDKNVRMTLKEITPLTANDIKSGLGTHSYHFVGSKNRSQYYPEAKLKKKLDENDIQIIKRMKAGGKGGSYVKTKDGVDINPILDSNKKHTFYDKDGNEFKCLGYHERSKDCLFLNLKTKKKYHDCVKGYYYNNPKEMWLSVDGEEPITYEEFYKINTESDVEALSKKDFDTIKNLKLGETFYGGMGADVKRVVKKGNNPKENYSIRYWETREEYQKPQNFKEWSKEFSDKNEAIDFAEGLFHNKAYYGVDVVDSNDESVHHISEEMKKGGQLKMLKEKYYYMELPPYKGFKWVGFWDGYHQFQAKEEKGYTVVRATDKDIEDGNLKDMIDLGVTREKGGSMAGGGATNDFDVMSLVGKAIWMPDKMRGYNTIISIRVIAKDNVKVETQQIGLTSTMTESYTLKELKNLSEGKSIRNNIKLIKGTETSMSAGGGMKKKYEFYNGDVVWDRGNKSYGVVLNNFDNPANGEGGEIRLDSDGMQSIFEYDKAGNTGEYNLVPYGSKEDKGGGDLTKVKESARRLIAYTKEDVKTKDWVMGQHKFYSLIYCRLLSGEFDEKKSSGGSMATGGGIKDVSTPQEFKEWATKRNMELIDELDGFHVGDKVKYTNEYGVSFEPRTIIGIDKDDSFYNRRFYLDKDSYWFPVKIEEIEKSMAKGGGVDDRMYNFLKDDLKKLEKAVNEGDQEEINKFFSYWGYHLKSLENKGFGKEYERMYNFLKDDFIKLEKAIRENDKEEIDRFFSYWSYHLKSLKPDGGSMENGGGVGDDKIIPIKGEKLAELHWYNHLTTGDHHYAIYANSDNTFSVEVENTLTSSDNKFKISKNKGLGKNHVVLDEKFTMTAEQANRVAETTMEDINKGEISPSRGYEFKGGGELEGLYDLRIGLENESMDEKIMKAIRNLFSRQGGKVDKKIMDKTISKLSKHIPAYGRAWKNYVKTFEIKEENGEYVNPFVMARGGIIISTDRAKEIASHWHGGQWDALYQFASSGVYMIANHLRYLKSIQDSLETEYAPHPYDLPKKDQAELNSLKRYFEYKGTENGIKTEWTKHPVYGYMIPSISKDTPDEISNKIEPLKMAM